MSENSSIKISLIYLHGFNSSPESTKAKSFIQYAQTELAELISRQQLNIVAPALPSKPDQAISLVEELIEKVDISILLGSSLGGFYSIYLAEKYGCKAVLINPLVALDEGMADVFLGNHTNPYTGQKYELNWEDAEFLKTLEVSKVENQKRYFLLAEKGDEVLDYRIAQQKFLNAKQKILENGSHRFESFEKLLPDIMEFSELAS